MIRCSSWSKKSVAYISASVRRVTAFLASNSSMSRPTRFDRRSPLVCTAKPSDSSHSCSKAICVERPEPSIPSMTTNWPVMSCGSKPTKDSPKKCCESLPSSGAFAKGTASVATRGAGFSFSCSGILFGFLHARSKPFQVDFRGHNVAHLLLQLVYWNRAIEHDEIVGIDHAVILLQDTRLKQPKAFGAVIR